MNEYEYNFKYIKMSKSARSPYNGHVVLDVRNKKSDDLLGFIYFYPDWNQFVFSQRGDAIFNNSCCLNIVEVIDDLNETEVYDE